MALIGAAKAGAQEIDDSFYNRTGDFRFVTQYMHPLPRDTRISIDSLISGPNVTSRYAIDPIVGLNNRIKFLEADKPKQVNSEEERKHEEERKLLIERYQSFISEILKEKRSSNYGKSLATLTSAVKDGIINPEEFEGVEDGVYMLVKEGKANGCNNPYSVVALVRLSKDSLECYETSIKPQEPRKDSKDIPLALPEAPKTPEAQCNPEVYGLDLTKPIPQVGYYPPNLCPKPEVRKKDYSTLYGGLPGFPLFLPEAPKEISKVLEEKKIEDKKQKGVYLSLIAQGNANSAFDNFGGSLGLGIGNEKVRIAALVDASLGLDKLVDSYSGPLSAGRTAYGTVTDTNAFSVGLSAEAQLGPFVFGSGADYSNWIRKTVEQILDSSGDVVKSNTNSLVNSGITGKVYGGVELPLSDSWKLGVVGGYDGRNGGYFGVRNVFRLNQPRKEKK